MLPSSNPALLLAYHDACYRSDQAIVAAKLTTSEALKPENAPRNRYTDVLPWDSSRVVLRGGSGDYINASHLRLGSSHFIAAQGPLPSTCQDFFRMLQQHAVRLVVALGPADEMGRVKFHPYWSHDSVTVKSQRQWDDCAVTERICSAIVGGEQHEFVHLHAYDWPDHGVPQASFGRFHSRLLASAVAAARFLTSARRIPLPLSILSVPLCLKPEARSLCTAAQASAARAPCALPSTLRSARAPRACKTALAK
jgi:hypothetical protein